MITAKGVSDFPGSEPLLAEEILELHAARILLLIHYCGTKNTLEGLTKMAKLDFFVRYPEFFDEVCLMLGVKESSTSQVVESPMVRFHYGPWDQRYYRVLTYLESRGLIDVRKPSTAVELQLTVSGESIAKALASKDSFKPLVLQMKKVKKVLGARTGSALKRLIYRAFEEEVGEKRMGQFIT